MTLHWDSQGLQWPHRECSRFVQAGALRWHVQHFPNPGGPAAVLLHGTGSATHSWRDLAPALQRRGFDVTCMDLPGHAFTHLPSRRCTIHMSLPGMAAGVGTLLRTLGVAPVLLAGHSAGAALAARMVLDGHARPRAIASLNGALLPWPGLPVALLSPVARVLAGTAVVPRVFAWHAAQGPVLARLLAGTGSRLDARGQALYRLLVGDAAHVAGALAMMAHWDLRGLARDLPRLPVPLMSFVGGNDRTVPPGQSIRAARLQPAGLSQPVVRWEGLGHLAHEEDPERVAEAIDAGWRRLSAGLPPPGPGLG
jgi:magnesium chelatase accessory protein